MRKKILLLMFLFGVFSILRGQELKVVDFQQSPLDISARENPVVDANGDACAIIKARTGLENIQFYSDLGIRKIEKHEGEYWLWVSAGTKRLTIESEKLGVVVYDLPDFTSEYMVYIVFLDAVLPDKIVYNDVAFLTFNTKPKRAKVFIDDNYFGKTPLSVTYPDNKFEYRIEKRKYLTVSEFDTISKESKIYDINLKLDPETRRLFFGPSISIDNDGDLDYGLNLGILKKKWGWVVSASFLIQDTESDGFRGEFLTYEDEPVPYSGLIKNRTRLNWNYLRKISKTIYFSTGIGISSNQYYYKAIVKSDHVFPENEYKYKMHTDNSYTGINLNLGVSYKFKDKLIISFRGVNNFQLLPSDSDGLEFDFKYMATDWNFGIGYIFI